jgi:hypothetical protein
MPSKARKIRVAWFVAGLLAAILPAAPAAAYAPGYAAKGTVTSAGVLVVGWGRIDFYLNRPTTQRLAMIAGRWDKSSQTPSEVATVLICTRFPTIWAEALCTAVLVIGGSYPLDQLAAADRAKSCLHIGLRLGLPVVAPDNGENCLGTRT